MDNRTIESDYRWFDPDELYNSENWKMPEDHCIWLFEGIVISDELLDPSSKLSERQLLVSSGERLLFTEVKRVILPHFNAGRAVFVEGDRVVILFHTWNFRRRIPEEDRIETGSEEFRPGINWDYREHGAETGQKEYFTLDFDEGNKWDRDKQDGQWSYILNLDTSICYAIGKGLGRNRHYVWPKQSYGANEGERFNRQNRINVSEAYIQVMSHLIDEYADQRRTLYDCNYRATTSFLQLGDNVLRS